MRKVTIIGGALLFAGACSDEPAGAADTNTGGDTAAVDASGDGTGGADVVADGSASDGAGSDVDSGDGATTDSATTDSATTDSATTDTGVSDSGGDAAVSDGGASDAGVDISSPDDVVMLDIGPKDTSPSDSGPGDVGPPDGAMTTDADPADGGGDVASNDTNGSDADACYKPTEDDVNKGGLLGTECKGGFLDAVCDSSNQVIAQCQYDNNLGKNVWEPWSGGQCGCFKTSCGPDQLDCIAIGFVGIAKSGQPRKVGRMLRAA